MMVLYPYSCVYMLLCLSISSREGLTGELSMQPVYLLSFIRKYTGCNAYANFHFDELRWKKFIDSSKMLVACILRLVKLNSLWAGYFFQNIRVLVRFSLLHFACLTNQLHKWPIDNRIGKIIHQTFFKVIRSLSARSSLLFSYSISAMMKTHR